MSHRPEDSRKFQDFRTLIREAESHGDAEAVMRRMAPEHVESVCKRLIETRGGCEGDDTEGSRWNVSRFENDELLVKYVHIRDQTVLYRKSEDHNNPPYSDCVFDKEGGVIRTFDPMRTWNVLNVLEEIIETGEISI